MSRPRRARQKWSSVAGGIMGLSIVLWLLSPLGEKQRMKGPLTPGHESLDCEQCHDDSSGTLRQRVQAKVRYWLDLRSSDISIGKAKVQERQCLDCHERPEDRHPIHRFLEPRFAEARSEIAPHNCISCHREHEGTRLSRKPDYCGSCHQEMEVAKDPIVPSHAVLIARNAWDTCLGCHDYHGNHQLEVATKLDQRLSHSLLDAYFAGDSQADPYGQVKTPSKKERLDQASGKHADAP